MLHRIEPPDCVPQLERIQQFQRDVLALACSEHTTLPLTEDSLRNVLGVGRGEWLWRKLWKQRGNPGETAFHLDLIAVIEYVQQHPNLRQTIVDAFDNDVSFHTSLDDPNFRFQFNTLDEETGQVLKPLMVSFYEDLLASGFENAIHGQPDKLDRDGFIASFWNTNINLEVCPACDRRRSPKVDIKVYDDADHYFPKSKYPFLSLHHANLVPLCLYCNRSFKGDRDPIDDHTNAPLTNIFHPYGRNALNCVDILVNRSNTGVLQIRFEDPEGMPSRRVQNLQRVFRLHEWWPDELRFQEEVLREAIADTGRRIRHNTNRQHLTVQELQDVLEDMLQRKNERLGRRPGYVLQTSYISFALQDAGEFEELLFEFVN